MEWPLTSPPPVSLPTSASVQIRVLHTFLYSAPFESQIELSMETALNFAFYLSLDLMKHLKGMGFSSLITRRLPPSPKGDLATEQQQQRGRVAVLGVRVQGQVLLRVILAA